jgi:GDP-D-mannose 3',5'-epimerase
MNVCVTGAGGFIGGHLVSFLKEKGHWVRGVDIKEHEFAPTEADEFLLLDLRERENCEAATRGMDWVFGLAADMGGMGFITANNARIAHNNALINLHTLEAARVNGVSRYLFTSSACVYPMYLQAVADVAPLREEDAYPADPQGAYGWEKLYFERVCQHYREDYGMETRIVRFHNCYGPYGAWNDGREKAPAALSRKVAIAKLTGNPVVEIWGDGEQTRSFMHIGDCLRGMYALMESDYHDPLQLGSDRLVTINQLVDIIAAIAGVEVAKKHIEGPQGVRGRNADLTLAREVLGWTPEVSLEDGIEETYWWIEGQVRRSLH